MSEYQALPDLDANADAMAIEHIKLENEGWERSTSVTQTERAHMELDRDVFWRRLLSASRRDWNYTPLLL